MKLNKDIISVEKKLKKQVRLDSVLSYADIKEALEYIDFDIHGVWLHNDRVNPSLSFSKNDNIVRQFFKENEGKTTKYFNDLGIDFLNGNFGDFLWKKSENFILFYLDETQESKVDIFLEICSLVARRSINWVNINLSISRRLLGTFKKHFASEHNLINNNYKLLIDSVESFDPIKCCIITCDENICLIPQPSSTHNECVNFPPKLRAEIMDTLAEKSESLNYCSEKNIPIILNTLSSSKWICLYPIKLHQATTGNTNFMLSISDTQFSSSCISRLVFAMSSYEEQYKKAKKLNIITSTYKNKYKGRYDSITKYSQIKKQFNKFLESFVSELFEVTNAFSFVIRFYDSASGSLIRFSEQMTPYGEYSKHQDGHKQTNEIKIKEHAATSVVAFTFLRGGEKLPYLYIDNINIIPNEYRELGLQSTLTLRKKTKSELCFPFLFGSIPIGTINIESDHKNGLQEDIDFFWMLKGVIEDTYEEYYKSTDSAWFRSRARYSDALHDLENYLRSGFFSTKQEQELKTLFFTKKDKEESLSVNNFGDIKIWLNNWIYSFYNKRTDETIGFIHGITEFNGDCELCIDNNIFNNIRLILKQFIMNVVNNSYIHKDKIIVSCDNNYSINRARQIRVRLKTYGIFDASELDQMCLSPIKKYENGGVEEHYGMYMVGLLTRSVGGAIIISKQKDEKATIFEIILPSSDIC